MEDVLPGWTVRGVKSSECVERKDGSKSDRKETDVFERHTNSSNASVQHTNLQTRLVFMHVSEKTDMLCNIQKTQIHLVVVRCQESDLSDSKTSIKTKTKLKISNHKVCGLFNPDTGSATHVHIQSNLMQVMNQSRLAFCAPD